jgi:hypothetical protein
MALIDALKQWIPNCFSTLWRREERRKGRQKDSNREKDGNGICG